LDAVNQIYALRWVRLTIGNRLKSNDKYAAMQFVYIHGANATPASFNYLREHLGDGFPVSYESKNGFKSNLEMIYQQIHHFDQVVFIGHSLGGIYALHLASMMPDRVFRGITLSTPYGGYGMAVYARMLMPFNALLNDIGPSSWPIRELNNIENKWDWCNVVTTGGNIPWAIGPNDGVVTIDSMRHRKDIDLIAMDCNHYEVLQSYSTVEIVNDRINSVKRERR